MGKCYNALTETDIRFISEQKIFFVGTATADSRVSVSPKGMDSFRVLGPSRAIWLNFTGSGNETSAHVQLAPRMTIMFCAFEGAPLILRLYGTARAVHLTDSDWDTLYRHFPPQPGARQIFDLSIDMVQSSCGFGVPLFNYTGEREMLNEWATKKGENGIRQYWEDKNQTSLDGLPTHIVKKNG